MALLDVALLDVALLDVALLDAAMLDELEHFLRIVEHGTFTAAAREAHLSQPALSASVRRLEEWAGARLFDRDRRGARLTAAGSALLPRARAALAALEAGRRDIADVAGLVRGEVRLGAGATACTYLLPATLARFRARFPGLRLLLRETTTDEARAALRQDELDLAIVSGAAEEPLEGELWRHDELVLVAAPGVDASSAPFLTFRRGATTRTLFDRLFPDAPIAMELASIAAVKGSARAGIGVALVSLDSVVDDLRRRLLVRIDDPRTPVRREMRLVRSARAGAAAEALATHLLEDAR
ncbi:MAG: LysR substrate-binding domain-containing protein [Myxococcota bacterium]